MRTSSPSSTSPAFFLNNLRMFNIYQPDSFLLAFLGRIMATDFEDYKDCRR